MSAPIVHVFSAGIPPDRVDAYRQHAREHIGLTESEHPGLLAYHLYLSEDSHRMSSVQVHPDADSMDLFRDRVLAEESAAAYQCLVRGSERSQGYGRFHDATLDRMRAFGVELHLHPEHLGGFTRLASS
jgi:hypothetical protein